MPSGAVDLTNFKKTVNGLSGVNTGFRDPKIWIDTGNYTLNKLISGDFHKGIPLGKITMFAGESQSGKSFVCSGNIVRKAMEQGCQVIILDTEDALDETWMRRMGIDTSDENKVMRVGIGIVDQVAQLTHELVTGYIAQNKDKPEDERPHLLIVIDSLGMLMTENEVKQSKEGDMKGDYGIKAKRLGSLMRNTINNISGYPVGVVMTNHVYLPQEDYADPVVSGGLSIMFSSSIVVGVKKLKLKAQDAEKKEDKEGRKDSDQIGIKIGVKMIKTRFSKPFETTQIHLPWNTGMDPYSGVLEFMKTKGYVESSGSWYSFTDADGKVQKRQRKTFTPEDYDYLMSVYDDKKAADAVMDVGIGNINEPTPDTKKKKETK